MGHLPVAPRRNSLKAASVLVEDVKEEARRHVEVVGVAPEGALATAQAVTGRTFG